MRKLPVFFASALASLALAAPVSAHQDHGSCKTFGVNTAAIAQTPPPGSFGAFVSANAPVSGAIAFFHSIECEPK